VTLSGSACTPAASSTTTTRSAAAPAAGGVEELDEDEGSVARQARQLAERDIATQRAAAATKAAEEQALLAQKEAEVAALRANRAQGDRAMNDGATPLLAASQLGHEATVAVLLANGAQVDLADSGVISYEEFDIFVSSENPYFEVHMESLKQRLRASAPNLEDVVAIFVYYDEDKTGQLDLRELRAMVRREARVTPEQLSDIDLEKLFCVMDTGKDGNVSVDDFLNFMKSTSARFIRVVHAAKKKMLTSVANGCDFRPTHKSTLTGAYF
jgi:hypothetical protein